MAQVDLGDGLSGMIVPGLTARDSAGVPDVMRGEETKLAGCGVADGIVVSPGTHAKWVRMAGGTIEGFATYMTGDFYGALTDHTILGKLAEEPEDEAGFARGLEASKRPGGLTHLAFSARTLVLMGELPGAQVDALHVRTADRLRGGARASRSGAGSAGDIVVISEGSVAPILPAGARCSSDLRAACCRPRPCS